MDENVEMAGALFAPITVEKKAAFSLKDLITEFPAGQTDWSIPEAYLCLVLSAALADGRVVEQEAEELKSLSHRSRILKSMDANELAALNQLVVKRRNDRPDWLGEACRTLPKDMHLPVFAHCLDLCLSDGALVQAEADFLEALIDGFSISAEDARQVTSVLSMKNRY